jgi:hypothetical protein
MLTLCEGCARCESIEEGRARCEWHRAEIAPVQDCRMFAPAAPHPIYPVQHAVELGLQAERERAAHAHQPITKEWERQMAETVAGRALLVRSYPITRRLVRLYVAAVLGR